MFGKVMSIKDDLVVKYFTLLTGVDQQQVDQYSQALQRIDKHSEAGDPLHPMQIKKALARSIVTEYHDQAAARRGEEHFERVVQKKEIPDEIPLRTFTQSALPACDIIASSAGVSKGEARRLITQGGVKLDGARISDPTAEIALSSEEQLLQVGKRKFFRIRGES
jgi:tyrosyl-tRNA synthetase